MTICADKMAYICAEDYQGWAAEGRSDCQGIPDSGIIGQMTPGDGCVSGKAWVTNHHFWSFNDNVGKTSQVPTIGGDCGTCYAPGVKEMRVVKLMRTQCWDVDYLTDYCNRAGGGILEAVQGLWGQWAVDVLDNDAQSLLRGVYESELQLNTDAIAAAVAAGNPVPVGSALPGNVYDADDTATNDTPGFFGFCAMIEGTRYLGCKRSELAGTIVHTDVYTNLLKSGQITMQEVDCIDGACIERAFLNNKLLIESEDECLIDDNGRYISVLFRDGALAYDVDDLGDRQMGFDQDPCANGGIGSEFWVTRERHVLHPVGWSNLWTPADAAVDLVPTQAELKDPANWCRVLDRRNTGLAFIVSSERAI